MVLQKYEITKTTRWVINYRKEMITGSAPTLKTILTAYPQNPNGIYDWLNAYLVDLAIFEGKTASAVAYQINSISHSIVEKYHYLKLTEIMLFFSMFKAGELIDKNGEDLTKMYGSFSGKVILAALRNFVLNYRNNVIYDEEKNKRFADAEVDYTKYLANVNFTKKEDKSKQETINNHNKEFLEQLQKELNNKQNE